MKFGGMMQSGSGKLLAVRKFPKNPRWPPARRRQFCDFVQWKGYLLLQFELDLLETWYTCSLDEGARCMFGGFFNFRLECHQVAFLSKIRFGS